MKKVLVGMSGGVDSSVAALLLQQQGYSIKGITFSLWKSSDSVDGCGSSRDVEDARKVCMQLGIPHEVIDLSRLFRKEVVDYFVEEYRLGHTPNPCVQCNRKIKFGAFWEFAQETGYDYIATGHYARVGNDEQGNGRWWLGRGRDHTKDQSYVLYHANQSQLSGLLLPLGEYRKEDIREIADRAGLVVANKPDSQDICFIPNGDYKAFLNRIAGIQLQPGFFIDENGKILGEHKGIHAYTIGQRKKLGISLGRQVFVSKISPEDNTITLVDDESRLFTREVFIKDLNFVSVDRLDQSLRADVKIRYAHQPSPAIVAPAAPGLLKITFDEPQRAPTPGQSAVFYLGERLAGGGTIYTPEKS